MKFALSSLGRFAAVRVAVGVLAALLLLARLAIGCEAMAAPAEQAFAAAQASPHHKSDQHADGHAPAPQHGGDHCTGGQQDSGKQSTAAASCMIMGCGLLPANTPDTEPVRYVSDAAPSSAARTLTGRALRPPVPPPRPLLRQEISQRKITT